MYLEFRFHHSVGFGAGVRRVTANIMVVSLCFWNVICCAIIVEILLTWYKGSRTIMCDILISEFVKMTLWLVMLIFSIMVRIVYRRKRLLGHSIKIMLVPISKDSLTSLYDGDFGQKYWLDIGYSNLSYDYVFYEM